jgi:GNAT superfamily N-acetyltransferase
MVMVREVVAADWQALRDIRLEALRDAPDAFGSTFAREAAFSEADWKGRISRGGNFLGYLPEASASEPAGLIGGYQEEPQMVELVGMYVRPRARGRGVGEALIATVIDWAQARNAASVHLWVTETNKPARLLYERCGFSLTSERQPLPSNPALGEVGMVRPLRPTSASPLSRLCRG